MPCAIMLCLVRTQNFVAYIIYIDILCYHQLTRTIMISCCTHHVFMSWYSYFHFISYYFLELNVKRYIVSQWNLDLVFRCVMWVGYITVTRCGVAQSECVVILYTVTQNHIYIFDDTHFLKAYVALSHTTTKIVVCFTAIKLYVSVDVEDWQHVACCLGNQIIGFLPRNVWHSLVNECLKILYQQYLLQFRSLISRPVKRYDYNNSYTHTNTHTHTLNDWWFTSHAFDRKSSHINLSILIHFVESIIPHSSRSSLIPDTHIDV